jgi:hypothetical protein
MPEMPKFEPQKTATVLRDACIDMPFALAAASSPGRIVRAPGLARNAHFDD